VAAKRLRPNKRKKEKCLPAKRVAYLLDKNKPWLEVALLPAMACMPSMAAALQVV
jgi:hypothetical protein